MEQGPIVVLIILQTLKEYMETVYDFILAFFKQHQVLTFSCNDVKNPEEKNTELRLSTGTNSNSSFFFYTDTSLYDNNQVKLQYFQLSYHLFCKVVSEDSMVLCLNMKSTKSNTEMRRNLFGYMPAHKASLTLSSTNNNKTFSISLMHLAGELLL